MTSEIMPNWLLKRAELTPDRLALLHQDEKLTFGELNKASISTANRIAAFGVQRGDHVALLLKNGTHYVEMIHALEYLGAIIVFLNTRLSAHELSWQLEDSDSVLLFYDEANRQRAEEIIDHSPLLRSCSWNELSQLPEKATTLENTFQFKDIHSIIYTSGTTGYPKGVMLSYGNHWWSAVASMLNLGLHMDDRWLASVPFFHVSGLSILMRGVIYGISVDIYESFDPQQINHAIKHKEISMISVVSTMLARLLENLGESQYPPSFRCVLAGGGPIPLHLLEDCKQRNIPVYQTYGMTETASQIVTLSPEYMLSKQGSAGKALFSAEIRIEQDGVVLPAGEVGEIVVRGANVTSGYYKRPEATTQAISEGWLYTGDLGYLDEDGFLYVVDRRSDLIISGGENVYPAEIEAVLTAHPLIEEAGVIGIEDPTWGQVPIAFVKLYVNCTCTVEEILLYCSTKLASYKVPKALYFVSEIPRNAANKILRRKLRYLIENALYEAEQKR